MAENFTNDLCSAERDRVTAAEICIDEILTIMDSRGHHDSMYSTLCILSLALNRMLREADGMGGQYERLIRVRKTLTDAFPLTDEDLGAAE
jgi:hypothetical protein